MPAFEYRQAEEVRGVFARHDVRYLFIGKSGAILSGFPDTTQEVALFVEKSPANRAENAGDEIWHAAATAQPSWRVVQGPAAISRSDPSSLALTSPISSSWSSRQSSHHARNCSSSAHDGRGTAASLY
jgi:hypothetical protein